VPFVDEHCIRHGRDGICFVFVLRVDCIRRNLKDLTRNLWSLEQSNVIIVRNGFPPSFEGTTPGMAGHQKGSACQTSSSQLAQLTGTKRQKHTTGGIPRWSPTLVLVARFSAYVWQSGRDAQFSLTYGRMYCDSSM
jgi:hypothetical protein